ncbi:hypothetical protein CL622_06695 [archaeon]|nr:hypothetical protein [archaeon]
MLEQIVRSTLRKKAGFKAQLQQAGIENTPEEFIRKSLMRALIMGGVLLFFVLLLALIRFGFNIFIIIVLILTLFTPFLFFNYFLQQPVFKMKSKQKKIDADVVFAGRYILIELTSGVPLYNAIANASSGYGEISKELSSVIKRVSLGTPIDKAIETLINTTPSAYFRTFLWQIMNALATGADMAQALQAILKQITAEQIVEMRDYGRKLNPIVMFYLMVTVIMPSLGVVIILILSMFLSTIPLDIKLLYVVAGLVGFAQLFFLLYIQGSRPGVSI